MSIRLDIRAGDFAQRFRAFLDTKRERVYVSCGEGFLAVLRRSGDTYEEMGRVPTVSGARTECSRNTSPSWVS